MTTHRQGRVGEGWVDGSLEVGALIYDHGRSNDTAFDSTRRQQLYAIRSGEPALYRTENRDRASEDLVRYPSMSPDRDAVLRGQYVPINPPFDDEVFVGADFTLNDDRTPDRRHALLNGPVREQVVRRWCQGVILEDDRPMIAEALCV